MLVGIIKRMKMRKEDIQAIKRAVALAKIECQEHHLCKECRLYYNNDCVLDRPPAHFDADEIIKCFT